MLIITKKYIKHVMYLYALSTATAINLLTIIEPRHEKPDFHMCGKQRGKSGVR